MRCVALDNHQPKSASNTVLRGSVRPREFHLYLTTEEREQLKAMVRTEKTLARKRRALALLRADQSQAGSSQPLTHIAFKLGFSADHVSKLVRKAAKYGAIKTALGLEPSDITKPRSERW